jgi:hypothetical protein
MTVIQVPSCLTLTTFEVLKMRWDRNKNVTIVLPKQFSDREIECLFEFLLPTLPNQFAFCILENVIDLNNVPMPLLNKLFDYGDTGCNVTICLKDDLIPELIYKCLNSKDLNVKEHFLTKLGLRAKQV